MDNITHSLTGLALARAGINRLSPRATLMLIISANIPDIDIVASARGSLAYLEAHRGYTHSILFLPLMAALSVLAAALFGWRRLPWMKAWLICCVGVGSHLLLDWTNSFGVRLLLPFSSKWFHLDLNGLYDIWILIVLGLAAIWPLFSGMVSREIGARQPGGHTSGIAALCFFLLFDFTRATLHDRAVSQLQARLYDGQIPVRAAALPDSFSPLRWQGIVETSQAYRTLRVDTLEELDLASAEIFYKPEVTQAIENAKASEPFRYCVYFFRFPVWSEQPVITTNGDDRRIELTDLRFGVPGTGSFHAVALENSVNKVLGSWFTFGSGTDLGWGK